MKEFVGEEQESDDHGEVEELAEDEASKVDVVSVKQSIRLDSDNPNPRIMYIGCEKLKTTVPS